MKNILNKIIIASALFSVVIFNSISLVQASDTAPTPPPAPSQPPAPTPTSNPPVQPTPPPSPTPLPSASGLSGNSTSASPTPLPHSTPKPLLQNTTDSSADSPTSLSTSNANASASASTNLNKNTASGAQIADPAVSAANVGNGAGSINQANINNSSANSANQTNGATITSGLVQSAQTGANSASGNIGATTLSTGGANATGTLINSANTNLAGVEVAQFNVADDQRGDLVLNFNQNCISGCSQTTSAQNSGNGVGSNNSASANNVAVNNLDQVNSATEGATLNVSASSGGNHTDNNTGGATSLTTGAANAEGNVLNLLNNNVAGKIIYSVVNIFGNLVGDIVLPQSALVSPECSSSTCSNNISSINAQNGSGSVNTASASAQTAQFTNQSNGADIANNYDLTANTGGNIASDNTGGNTSVTTGDAQTTARGLTVANTNVSQGGNVWLVLINQAGQWIGKILGMPDGATSAASAGITLTEDTNGNVSASNSGNGAGSVNSANSSSTSSNSTNQSNTANLNSTIKLNADSGSNTASDNTGANVNIKTGDAKAIANLINFVNNNISGGGKLIVTVVNVFGSWIGDFVTPGGQKDSSNSQPTQANATSAPSSSHASDGGTQNVVVTSSSTTPPSSSPTVLNTFIKSVQNRVLGAFAISSSQNQPSLGSKQTLIHTPLIASQNIQKSPSAGKIVINLAWLLIILPLSIFSYVLLRASRKTHL